MLVEGCVLAAGRGTTIMKRASRLAGTGFTLIELLVVIAIIAILAAMTMAAIVGVKGAEKKKRAQLQMGQIAMAIHGYETDNNHVPCSTTAMNRAAAAGEDFTYGADWLSGTCPGLTLPASVYSGYTPNTSDVMAILLDVEKYPGTGQPTINDGHVKNPRKTAILSATRVGDTTSPGVGTDLVYRDPWGSPYIISLDLNMDGKTRDVFYRLPAVSGGGVNGLGLQSTLNVYELTGAMMIWSLGPDKKADPTVSAKLGANKDNMLSWGQ
jgi:prepilin-type N-terminal cleavage/methylation domain-containing protein